MTSMTQNTSTSTKKSYSLPRMMLGIEGLAVFIASLVLYAHVGGNWWLFFALLLSPDLVFVIYMVDKSTGITAYNLVHTYTAPVTLGVVALVSGWSLGLALAMIWFAHIGIDRTVGYGLKYKTGSNETHLQRATQP